MLQFACKKALTVTVFSVLVPASAWALSGESFKAYEDLKAKADEKTEAKISRRAVAEAAIKGILKKAYEKQSESVGEVHSLDVHALGLEATCRVPKRSNDCNQEISVAFAYQNSKEACQGEQILRSVFQNAESDKPNQISYLRVSCVSRITLDERKVWIVLDQNSEDPEVREVLLKQDKRKL